MWTKLIEDQIKREVKKTTGSEWRLIFGMKRWGKILFFIFVWKQYEHCLILVWSYAIVSTFQLNFLTFSYSTYFIKSVYSVYTIHTLTNNGHFEWLVYHKQIRSFTMWHTEHIYGNGWSINGEKLENLELNMYIGMRKCNFISNFTHSNHKQESSFLVKVLLISFIACDRDENIA